MVTLMSNCRNCKNHDIDFKNNDCKCKYQKDEHSASKIQNNMHEDIKCAEYKET